MWLNTVNYRMLNKKLSYHSDSARCPPQTIFVNAYEGKADMV